MPGREAWSAAEVARLLNGKRSGERWKAKCPAHDDGSPSLMIWQRPDGRVGLWCASGCDWGDVVAAVRSRGAVIGKSKVGATLASGRSSDDADRRDADRQRFALQIWHEARPARGSPAELYLGLRGLALPRDVDGRVIRFHPACPRGPERVPAMVVGLRAPEGDEVVGISRTYLTRDYKRAGERMALGRMGIAKISNALGELGYVCEGLETGLALWLGGYRPVWALMSAGKLERFPRQAGVAELVACLDNDLSRTGWRAGQRLAEAWPPGSVRLWMPREVGKDFADLLHV
jgi:hypothetical protein